MKVNRLSIKTIRSSYQTGELNSSQVIESCLDEIRRLDSKVKAFVTVADKKARALAKKADEKIKKGVDWKLQPLLGIPLAIKDNFCTQDIKTTASSRVLENFIPPYSATVVERLEQAGAIVIGKTNMDAWAHGSSTETSDFFTTHNPWNLNHLPGGSSGGSAGAVAAGMVPAAIGSETAGSIRQPAAWCGVTGLKPTYGRVSRYGVIAMASSTDSPGPITRTAEDAGLILQVIAGQDGQDATLSPKPVEKYSEMTSVEPANIKIGVPRQYFEGKIDPVLKKAVETAIGVYQKAGFEITKVNLLDPAFSIAVYTIVQRSEVSSNLARYDGVRFGNNRSFFGDEAKRRMMLGAYALSAGYYDQYYAKAQKVRTRIIEDFDRVFRQVDLLIAPTTPTPALRLGASKDQAMFGEFQDVLVEASSLAGLPGISLPCGFSGDLPIGFQLFGPQFSEKSILGAAHFYQQATDWHLKFPRISA